MHVPSCHLHTKQYWWVRLCECGCKIHIFVLCVCTVLTQSRQDKAKNYVCISQLQIIKTGTKGKTVNGLPSSLVNRFRVPTH